MHYELISPPSLIFLLVATPVFKLAQLGVTFCNMAEKLVFINSPIVKTSYVNPVNGVKVNRFNYIDFSDGSIVLIRTEEV